MSEISNTQTDGASEAGGAAAPGADATAGAAPATAPAGDTGAPATTEQAAPTDWKSSLPDELRSDPSLGAIQTVESLAKGYISAQKMVGKANIPIPDKFASDADWKSVFTRLGVPEKFEDYTLNVPKEANLPDENVGQFKQVAHAAGILPRQAEKVLEWYGAFSNNSVAEAQKANEAEVEKGLAGLKEKLGDAYDATLDKGSAAVKHFGGEQADALFDAFDKTGAGDNPVILEFLGKVGSLLVEDKVIGEPADGAGALTPKDAQAEVNKIYGNPEHAYNNPGHPNHKLAVQEMFKLNQMIHGNKPVLDLTRA